MIRREETEGTALQLYTGPAEAELRGEVGGYFGNRRAYDHNCCIQTGNSVGEGLADKLTTIWDPFLIKTEDQGHDVWPFRV